MKPLCRKLAVLIVAIALAGCAGPGLFTDGTSVSVGSFARGLLRRGRRLPPKGEGYVVPPLWQKRGALFATDELVAAIRRAAARVRREYPGGLLGIGDLSVRGGGDSKLHRSHENGRDADLIFYALDERGRPVPPTNAMPTYAPDLRSGPPHPTKGVRFGPFSPRRFDVRRNWALVRALLEDPQIEVQFLFCHEALKRAMLDYAVAMGEDPAIVDEAESILHQPGDSLPHDDHLHLRIYCATTDRALGCVDRGPVRWWKKRWKYMPPGARPAASAALDLLDRIGVLPPISL